MSTSCRFLRPFLLTKYLYANIRIPIFKLSLVRNYHQFFNWTLLSLSPPNNLQKKLQRPVPNHESLLPSWFLFDLFFSVFFLIILPQSSFLFKQTMGFLGTVKIGYCGFSNIFMFFDFWYLVESKLSKAYQITRSSFFSNFFSVIAFTFYMEKYFKE